MLSAPSCPSLLVGIAILLPITELVIIRVSIWWRFVWVVTRIPLAAAEHPSALHSSELDRHINAVLGPDIVVGWVSLLNCFGSVKYCARHDTSSALSTLVLGEDELDCLPYRY